MQSRLPITELQRNLGDISLSLIRGEEIIITRNGKDFAKLSPIDPKFPKFPATPKEHPPFPRLPKKEAIREAQAIIQQAEEQEPEIISMSITHICQVPNATCKNPAEAEYNIEYFGEEGIEKKQAWLCEFHRKKATESGASVTKLIAR